MQKRSLLLALVTAGVYCEVLSDGNGFSGKFMDFKSLFANDEIQLQQNVDRLSNLLNTVHDKMGFLRTVTNEAQKSTLDKIGDMATQVANFRRSMSNVGINFSQKKIDWEQLVNNIFVKEGLNNILPLLQNIQNGTSRIAATLTRFIPLVALALWQ